VRFIGPDDVSDKLNFTAVVDALKRGHKFPKADTGDTFLGTTEKMLLSRSARIEGMGFGVKSVSVLPNNSSQGLPTVQGGMLVLDDRTGSLLRLASNWCGRIQKFFRTCAQSKSGTEHRIVPKS